VIESFPLGLRQDGLAAADFKLLAGAFSAIVSQAIPGKPPVSFPASAAEATAGRRDGKHLAELYRRLSAGEESGVLYADVLMLALPLADGGRQVALAANVDKLVTTLAAADWLQALAARLPAELAVAKRLWLDYETALPNIACLRADLAAFGKNGNGAGGGWRLLLAEAPPGGRRDGFAQTAAVADVLRLFCPNARLFHLGQCLFAILAEDATSGKSPADLVWHLKNEGFRRVRIGSSGMAANLPAGLPLLDRAWTALREARRRGPFAFCDFTALTASPARWRPSGKLLAHFPGHAPFAVLALAASGEAREEIGHFLAERYKNIFINSHAGHILIFLAGADYEEARQWAQTMLSALAARLSGPLPHAGIAVHAKDGEEKLPAVTAKAVKAARHAGFYGPGGIAVFDAVTCNIAGDAHFADGNLPQAIKEYRAGLALEPANVNLLNSLGVALAMLNRHGEATLLFQRALAADMENCMVLTNLGFIAQLRHRQDETIDFFARALPPAASKDEHRQLAQDLRFYLGRLYCRTKRYDEARAILTEWQDFCASDHERRQAWPYLGEALADIGEMRPAMVALSRAIAANPGDHQSMSLLGELIMRLDEGNDIALALCKKSVELAPSSPLNRLRLAEAEYRRGDLPAALAHCPRLNRRRTASDPALASRAASLLANIYRQMGKTKQKGQTANSRQPAAEK